MKSIFVPIKLKNRFNIILEAVCAQIMCRNIAVIRWLKTVNQTTRSKTVQMVVLFFLRKLVFCQELAFKLGTAAQDRRILHL